MTINFLRNPSFSLLLLQEIEQGTKFHHFHEQKYAVQIKYKDVYCQAKSERYSGYDLGFIVILKKLKVSIFKITSQSYATREHENEN